MKHIHYFHVCKTNPVINHEMSIKKLYTQRNDNPAIPCLRAEMPLWHAGM
jgi:hypothetical protein